jgi:hypothetical protein
MHAPKYRIEELPCTIKGMCNLGPFMHKKGIETIVTQQRILNILKLAHCVKKLNSIMVHPQHETIGLVLKKHQQCFNFYKSVST